MYFSAACLIGLRPLFNRLPRWIKVRILSESDKTAHTFGHQSSSRRDHYSNIRDGHATLSAMRDHPAPLYPTTAHTNTSFGAYGRASGLDDIDMELLDTPSNPHQNRTLSPESRVSLLSSKIGHGTIRVDTKIEVRSTNGEDTH